MSRLVTKIATRYRGGDKWVVRVEDSLTDLSAAIRMHITTAQKLEIAASVYRQKLALGAVYWVVWADGTFKRYDSPEAAKVAVEVSV